MTRCGEIMTENITFCPPNATLTSAAKMMRDADVGVLPITRDDHELLGVITDRDIVVRGLAEDRSPSKTTAADIMSDSVETCRTNEEIEAVMDRMSQAKIRRIPVVDDDYRVIGMISQGDIALRVDRAEDVGRVVEDVSRPDDKE